MDNSQPVLRSKIFNILGTTRSGFIETLPKQPLWSLILRALTMLFAPHAIAPILLILLITTLKTEMLGDDHFFAHYYQEHVTLLFAIGILLGRWLFYPSSTEFKKHFQGISLLEFLSGTIRLSIINVCGQIIVLLLFIMISTLLGDLSPMTKFASADTSWRLPQYTAYDILRLLIETLWYAMWIYAVCYRTLRTKLSFWIALVLIVLLNLQSDLSQPFYRMCLVSWPIIVGVAYFERKNDLSAVTIYCFLQQLILFDVVYSATKTIAALCI